MISRKKEIDGLALKASKWRNADGHCVENGQTNPPSSPLSIGISAIIRSRCLMKCLPTLTRQFPFGKLKRIDRVHGKGIYVRLCNGALLCDTIAAVWQQGKRFGSRNLAEEFPLRISRSSGLNVLGRRETVWPLKSNSWSDFQPDGQAEDLSSSSQFVGCKLNSVLFDKVSNCLWRAN